MANSNATQIKINLQDSLNLNTNKAEISDFAGFNRRNAPFFNGGLSPLFKQEKTGSVIDKEGNVYKCENGNFYKNDVVIATGIEQQKFIKEKLSVPSEDSDIYWSIDADSNLFTVERKTSGTASLKYKSINRDIQVYSNIQVGYANSYEASSQMAPTYKENKSLFYCLTWDNANSLTGINNLQGKLYWVFVPYNTYYYQIYSCDFSFKNFSKPYKKATVTVVDDYVYYSPSLLPSLTTQIRVQFVPEEMPTKDIGPVFICIIPGEGSMPYPENLRVYTEASPNYIIRKEFSSVYSTDLKPQLISTDNNVVTRYKLSFTFSGYYDEGTITKNLTPNNFYPLYHADSFIDNSSLCFYDGNSVSVMGLAKKNSKLLTISYIDDEGFYYGSGCQSIDSDNNFTFSRNFISKGRDGFSVLYNNDSPTGISYNHTLLTNFLDVIEYQRIRGPYLENKVQEGQCIMYKSASDRNWYRIRRGSTESVQMTLIENRYIVMNTIGFFNTYDIEKDCFIHFFYDYNNSSDFGYKASNVQINIIPAENPTSAAAGINVNYEIKMNPLISAIFNPVILYCGATTIDTVSIYKNVLTDYYSNVYYNYSQFSGNYKIYKEDFYFNADAAKIPVYIGNDKELQGVPYPVSTDGNIILSPSFFATFFDSQIGADYIKDGRYYNLIYYEGMPLLAYYYGSGVANSEARFVIQGQSFVIRNGLIYSTSYYNGLMNVGDAIVNVDDLKFIGSLPLAAFFYSPATKCVLAFTGDRNLSTAFEATELKSVLNYKYAPNDNSLYLATEDAVYVLFNTPDGTSFVYKIEEQNVTDFVPQDNGCIAMKSGNIWKIYSFFERDNFERVPLKLSTKFYGAGLNRVSTVDCWYIRLFTDEAVKGSVKVKVHTLTNRSCTSEEQVFSINKEDWDKDNGFIYLRYQPKLQRSVGVSLSVESDFAIYDIQAGIKPDSTIQITEAKGF